MMKRFKRAKRSSDWLAVGLSAKGIGYVHIERTSLPKPKVKLCEFAPIVQAAAETLRNLHNRNKLGRYPCTHLLSAEEYKVLQVDPPKVPAAELKRALRWQVKDMLDFPVEEATIDAIEIPAKEAGQHNSAMYAVAAPNKVISQLMTHFRESKLQLQVIDIPEMAQRNVAALFEQYGRALASLSFGSDGKDCLLTFTAGGELYMARRIEISLRQIQDANEGHQHQFLERLVLELQRSLDHFDRQYHSLSLSKLMLAPLSGVTELQRYLAENLDVDVGVMDLNDVLDLAVVPEMVDDLESQGQFFLLFGAALREGQEIAV